MKIEEAIEWMEETIQDINELFDQCSTALQEEITEQKEVFELALTALRSMQEAGEPLSLEQLKQMDGKPVWCEDLEFGCSCWGYWNGDGAIGYFSNFAYDDYGTGWLAYSYPPAHIDRSKWISVKERLPDDEKDGETVLAVVFGKPHKNITLHHAIMTAEYFYQGGWLVDEYPEWENPIVTHWMPLPEPPEED